MEEIEATSPYYFFVPRNDEFKEEYQKGYAINEVFVLSNSGVVTARDGFVLDFDKDALRERIVTFRNKKLDDQAVKEQLSLSENYAWRVSQARKELMEVDDGRPIFSAFFTALSTPGISISISP